MICPKCKLEVEDDSYFCDQCGQEILICPKCGRPGGGKMCIYDGTALVPAKERPRISPISTGSNVAPHQSDTASAIKGKSPSSGTSELHLINKNLSLDLKVEGDEIIGRGAGIFAHIFEGFPQVSRRHCQIKFDEEQGWSVVDLGSTNGTRCDDMQLQQGQIRPLKDGSYLVIANIEFYVEIRDNKESRTIRV